MEYAEDGTLQKYLKKSVIIYAFEMASCLDHPSESIFSVIKDIRNARHNE